MFVVAPPPGPPRKNTVIYIPREGNEFLVKTDLKVVGSANITGIISGTDANFTGNVGIGTTSINLAKLTIDGKIGMPVKVGYI